MTFPDLIPTLQLATGPVILISGIGLLLLSMTNRFARVVDRSRKLAHELHGDPGADRPRLLAQLAIMARRARLVRAGIALAAMSVLLAALLIITLFCGVLLGLNLALVVVTQFVLCLLCLVCGLVCFLWDINVSLKALWLELPPELPGTGSGK